MPVFSTLALETALALHAYRGLLGSTKSIHTTQQRLNSTAVATLNRQFPRLIFVCLLHDVLVSRFVNGPLWLGFAMFQRLCER
jgi:hypothetical protein